jgi:hypothetical protein
MTTSFAIRQMVKAGEIGKATAAISDLLRTETGLLLSEVSINDDRYSLNSVNGIASAPDGKKLFFKFHTEEGEADTVGEYYKAHVLAECGLPVDLPFKASTVPGRQFLLYAFRDDVKLADECLRHETGKLTNFTVGEIIAAQEDLEALTLKAAVRSLAPQTAASETESIHQLFHHRLVDAGDPSRLGGRYKQFYQQRCLAVANEKMSWEDFENLSWTINGVTYRHTLRDLFERSREILDPHALSKQPVIVSHGDAHNANIWVTRGSSGRPALLLFDPAFAGKSIPALLGEVKATFHNIFAHPLWLYTPDFADRAFQVAAERNGNTLVVSHDWQLSDLRHAFLRLKLEKYWCPLVRQLRLSKSLPDHWEDMMRSALFCCPTLVMNLLPGAERTASVSLLAFSIAVMCGSPPAAASKDPAETFFSELREAAC